MLLETDGSLVLFEDNLELRRFDFKRLELACTALRVLGSHRVAQDLGPRIIGHDPLGDPELPFRRLSILAIAHRKIDGLTTIIQVNHELRPTIPLARCWIDGNHSKSHWVAPLKPIVQRAISWLAGAKEVREITVHYQAIATRWSLPSSQRCCQYDSRCENDRKSEILVYGVHGA
jgi:hypothetical protein